MLCICEDSGAEFQRIRFCNLSLKSDFFLIFTYSFQNQMTCGYLQQLLADFRNIFCTILVAALRIICEKRLLVNHKRRPQNKRRVQKPRVWMNAEVCKISDFWFDLQNSKERKLQLQISEIAHANRLDSANTNVWKLKEIDRIKFAELKRNLLN